LVLKRIGILTHPRVPASQVWAQTIREALLKLGLEPWLGSAWDVAGAHEQVPGTDLIVTLGGDGTILRAARIAVPLAVPLLAVNLGRLGFMTEVWPHQAVEALHRVLRGEGWIDQRVMLEAEVIRAESSPLPDPQAGSGVIFPVQALNDVVLGRGSLSRVIYVRASVNGDPLTTYTCDGVIVSSPTGSTAYSLAAGGPIMHPEMANLLLTPISPYLSLPQPVVLPADAEVELHVQTDHQAAVSIDGQIELPIGSGDMVKVRRSSCVTRFWRLQPKSFFLATLAERLGREVRPCSLNSASPTSP
jgi:NAD+ kinase